MRVAIIGAGAMGARRASVAAEAGDAVTLVADVVLRRAQKLAERFGSTATAQWEDALDGSVDAVVVSTTNNMLSGIASAALEAGVPVLCEKPMGRTRFEAAAVAQAARKSGAPCQVGFTLRHHEAIRDAHELVDSGRIGAPIGLRAAYGHGGRSGYEREWRADPDIAGGGELLDQGVHLVDLLSWFLGDITQAAAMLATSFWPVSVEDNAFALLRSHEGAVATIHTSWTQWRNLFRLEVIGADGAVVVDGLGGTYAPERITVVERLAAFGPPAIHERTVDTPEDAWVREWFTFRRAVAGESEGPTADDGLRAAVLVDSIYKAARTGSIVTVSELWPEAE